MVTDSLPTGYAKRRCEWNAKVEIAGRHYCGVHAKKEQRERVEAVNRFDRLASMRTELRRAISLVLGEAKANGSIRYSSRAMLALREAWEEARKEL